MKKQPFIYKDFKQLLYKEKDFAQSLLYLFLYNNFFIQCTKNRRITHFKRRGKSVSFVKKK